MLMGAIALCVLLAAGLVYSVRGRLMRTRAAADESDPVVASGPAQTGPAQTGPLSGIKMPAKRGDGPGQNDAALPGPIQLSADRLQQIGVTTAVAQMKEASDALQAPGDVAVDEEHIAYVQTRFPGWIRTVFANATYQYVKKGQRLFTIYSPDLVSTEQEYLLAKQNQQTSVQHMHGMAAEEGNWLLSAAEERLRRFDIPDAEIAAMERSGTAQREVGINSPVSGWVMERNAIPNAYVQPDTKLYTIADLSTVWVYAHVFQGDVGRLKPGNAAEVTVDAYPGRKFRGRIDQILPEVDAATRTVKVRLVFSNPGVVLKPGMYVTVNVSAPLGRQLMIPASGVLQAGDRQIAYLDHGDGSLEPRVIETGPQVNDLVVVLKGLKAGDRIVSSANFLVDSEAQLQGAAADGAQPASAPVAAPATGQDRLDLTTDPNPPRRGANTVHVKLTGKDGKPVDGAGVTVTFSMPAMSEMGMAAMKAQTKLTGTGNGNYAGTLQLGSGGTWQVTITAVQNGKTIATRHTTMSAAGGM